MSQPTSWAPVDLASLVAGGVPEEAPAALARSDGVLLLYPGRVHALYGEPESLKSWVALEACRQELESGRHVVYIDFEDSYRGLYGRLRALGADDAAIFSLFHYVAPVERISAAGWADLEAALEPGPTLVVIDGVTEAMTGEGLAIEKNADIALFYDRLPRPLARRGPAVLMLDHVVKAKDSRGRFAIGGQAKLAGLDGAAYAIEPKVAFGRGRTGISRLYVTKDRLGRIAAHTTGKDRLLGEVRATADLSGGVVTVTIGAVDDTPDTMPPARRKLLNAALAIDGAATRTQIVDKVVDLFGHGLTRTTVSTELNALRAAGYLDAIEEPGKATLWFPREGVGADTLPTPMPTPDTGVLSGASPSIGEATPDRSGHELQETGR